MKKRNRRLLETNISCGVTYLGPDLLTPSFMHMNNIIAFSDPSCKPGLMFDGERPKPRDYKFPTRMNKSLLSLNK